MSIKVMNLVWNSTLEGPSKRFALLALADRASDQGEITALGVPNLCRKTGIARSTMFRLLKELEHKDQLIQRVEQYRENQSRKASRFWINVPLLQALQQSGDDDREQGEPINPFIVSAAQSPVSNRDGTPSQIGTGPIPDRDGLGVSNRDGARPGDGPLSPYPFSDTEYPDPESERTDKLSSEETEFRESVGAVMAQLDLNKVGAQPKQRRQAEAKLHRLLRQFEFNVVSRHAQSKLAEANTCTYFLRGLEPEHVDSTSVPAKSTPSTEVVPEWCGQCDREGEHNPQQRWVETDTGLRRCSNCHPKAATAA